MNWSVNGPAIGSTALAAGLAHAHRVLPRLTGYVHTAMFVNTRGLDRMPDDVCPLGADRVPLEDVPRVATAYVWGGGQPSVLALHGWATDSTTMSAVVDAAVAHRQSVLCFDAPGHGVSPGSQATITEYSRAVVAVLQQFPSIQTVVAHSLSAIAAVAAIADIDAGVTNLVLLAPACSLSGVLDRWAVQRNLPVGVTKLIAAELHRRDGVPISHWDIRTLGLPDSVRVRILHDPQDQAVSIADSFQIAASTGADVEHAAAVGHHGITGCDQMRAAVSACLQPETTPPMLSREVGRSP